MPTRFLFVIILMFVMFGCDRSNTEMEKMRNEIAELKTRTDALESKNRLDEIFEQIEKIAYLEPSTEGYSVIEYDLGRMTVKIENVVAYANGSKVTIKFGNPLSATITGLEGDVEWGPVDKEGSPDVNNTKKKKIKISEKIYGGSWVTVNFVLEDIPPHNFGFVRFKNLTHTSISLNNR